MCPKMTHTQYLFLGYFNDMRADTDLAISIPNIVFGLRVRVLIRVLINPHIDPNSNPNPNPNP